jgi:selenide,water dikinase
MDSIPLLAGAAEAAAAGEASSLAPANALSASSALGVSELTQVAGAVRVHSAFPLLWDPQTAGGLLAGVSPAEAAAALRALRLAGFRDAAVVGEVAARPQGEAKVALRLGSRAAQAAGVDAV